MIQFRDTYRHNWDQQVYSTSKLDTVFLKFLCGQIISDTYRDAIFFPSFFVSLEWRHNEHDGVSNHQPHDCLLNRFFKAQINENMKVPRHWPLWVEFTVDRWFPAQRASNADNDPIWWRHHVPTVFKTFIDTIFFYNILWDNDFEHVFFDQANYSNTVDDVILRSSKIKVAHMSAMSSQINCNSVFVQQPERHKIKGNIKAPHYRPICEGNPPVTDGFPSQKTTNA